MASALKLLASPKSGLELSLGITGVPGVIAESAIEYGAGFGLGQIYHRYGDNKFGRNAPRIAAGVGKFGALLVGMATGGGFASGLLNKIGSAGVTAMGLEHGLRMARSSTGKRAVLIPKDAALPASGREVTSIGQLPPAPAGRGLSWDQIEELAAMH